MTLELDGVPMLLGFEPTGALDWAIAVGLGVVTAGVHTLALKLSTYPAEGVAWGIYGAEVWSESNEQVRLDP